MSSRKCRRRIAGAALLFAGLATTACSGGTSAGRVTAASTPATSTVPGAPAPTPATSTVPQSQAPPPDAPASVGAATQAAAVDADLAAIDASLKTFDSEQANAASGLAADEGDPSK